MSNHQKPERYYSGAVAVVAGKAGKFTCVVKATYLVGCVSLTPYMFLRSNVTKTPRTPYPTNERYEHE